MLWVPLASLLAGASLYPVQSVAVLASTGTSAGQERAAADNQVLLGQYFEHLYAGHFDEALKTASQIDAGEGNARGEAMIAVLRAAALNGLKRDSEAKSLYAEAERLRPHSPDLSMLAFQATFATGRFEVVAGHLDTLIARAPDLVRQLPPELVWNFLNNEPEGETLANEDRRIALARLGYGGEAGDMLASDAVRILVARGDMAGAGDLLRYIDDAGTIEDMLIQKRYSGLWPRIEERAGPNLEKVRLASVRAAENAYAAAPDDAEKLSQLIDALRSAGRHSDAIALRSKLPASKAELAQASVQQGWAINNIAWALHEARRPDDADQLLTMLTEAEMAEGTGHWLINMKINRLSLLVGHGRFNRAMELMTNTEQSAKSYGNPYAQQLVRGLKYCTFAGLGRKDETDRLLEDLVDHSGDAVGATVNGLLCGGEFDRAEQVALEALKDKDPARFEADFVRNLQPRPLTSDVPSIWDAPLAKFRGRPAIAAEYERLGRDMPEQFLPRSAD